MKVIVFSREKEDYTSLVDVFLSDFERQTGHCLEVVDPYSIEGVSLSEAYGLMEFPTIIAVSDGGVMQNMWRGTPLPAINEVAYYLQ